MKIMVLTPYLPHRRVGHGGGTAVRDLVKHLALNHEVLVASLIRPDEENLIEDVESLGVQVAKLPFLDTNSRGSDRLRLLANRVSANLRSLFSGFPAYVEKYWHKNTSQLLIKTITEFQPDAIQVEYLQMSLYCRDLSQFVTRGVNPSTILNTHELGSTPWIRRADQSTSPLVKTWARWEASRWEHLQLKASQWVKRTLCVTPEDHQEFSRLGGQNLTTVPLGMDLDAIKVDRKPQFPPICLFVGSFHHRPNVLAAELLVRKIWPQVRLDSPHCSLILAGRGSRKFLDSFALSQDIPTDGISALGFVDDLTPIFRKCHLFVAPLPEGGGIKIKILEAMARGIPIVTTEVGAEGIGTGQTGVLTLASPGNDFASAVVEALTNPKIEDQAQKARLLMEKQFSWKAISNRLVEIYQSEK
ncbi:MAG: glycosyltransferase family 4 protein [bacterium]|nr:glycosyltransferase family 4 protein [bacterium]